MKHKPNTKPPIYVKISINRRFCVGEDQTLSRESSPRQFGAFRSICERVNNVRVSGFFVNLFINLLISLVFVALLYLAMIFVTYPLTARNIQSMMAEKNVVLFEDIQNSRFYLVYDNGNSIAYTFTTSTLLNRYRALEPIAITRNGSHIILMGRLRYFHVHFNNTEISYFPTPGGFLSSTHRFNSSTVVSLVMLALLCMVAVYGLRRCMARGHQIATKLCI